MTPHPSLPKERKIYYPRFKRIIKCLAVEVCEGEGTMEVPMRLVYYVHDEQGKLLGKIDEFDVIKNNDNL